MSGDIAIQLDALSKCYRIYDKPQHRLFQMLGRSQKQYREFWALRNVSLDIRRGETVGIIGQNGSGKSTLLQMICGTVTPSSGAVKTYGRIAALLELGSGFNPEFTGRENVYLNGALLGLSKAEIDARFNEIADFAGIGNFMEQAVKTYSSGMTVRLAFAVSVCVEPDILVVDEALAVGDASFQFKCLNRLAVLTQQGTTLLFVSHDLNMVRRFCNRVVYLRLGEVRASGAPDEVAELYMLDLRDDQQRWATGTEMPVKKKAFVGAAEGFAFGTEEGRVLSARFTDSQEMYSSFVYGDMIEIRVECLLNSNIQHPGISLTIQEMRLLIIGGGNFTLHPEPAENGWQKAGVTVRFPARLGAGRYHVTIKLLDGHTEETSRLIEKQVALLSFDALPGNKDFLGIFDLGLEQV